MSYTYNFAPRARSGPAVPVLSADRFPWRKPAPPKPPAEPAVKRRLSADRIAQEVAAKHGVTMAQIMGDNRHKPVVLARQEAWWRIWRELGHSYPRIGNHFGKDHTTVMYGVKKYIERMEAGE